MADVNLTDVQAALDVVLAEIRARGWEPRDAAVRADDVWSGSGPESETSIVVSYGGHEFAVESDLAFGALVALITDRVQDDVIDDEQQGWPLSSDGRRLLSAGVRDSDGSAWWFDRAEPVAPIGAGRS
jgi:hypothetical protein